MDLLVDSAKRMTSVKWPDPVDDRLEVLLALLKAEGEQVSRSQLLAALVARAPLDGGALAETVRTYRRQMPQEFTQATAAVVDLPTVRHPGAKRRTDR
jgi:DNA-binding response OmpR family regulator